MTETEWLSAVDVDGMWEFLMSRFSEPGPIDRKVQLFVAACCEPLEKAVPPPFASLISLCEGRANNRAGRLQWGAAFQKAGLDADAGGILFAIDYDDYGLACYLAARAIASMNHKPESSGYTSAFRRERERQAILFREIAGNPFRPMSLDDQRPAPAHVQLAQAVYDGRTFDRMSELADALEREGCASEEVLTHCRGPGPHVRGCWVLDLILGKA